MGIKGLLKFLKSAERDVNIQSFRGKTVAVDGYCWLHRGAHSCLIELTMKNKKIEELPLIGFCMKRINLLRRNDIKPVVVFDGANLPMKADTEKERHERRQSCLSKGKALLKEGKEMEAKQCLRGSINVTPEMALAFIKVLRKENVDVVVAPYEADSQLAYLTKIGYVDLVITEDSDLLAFGCPKVLFKMDENGNGKLIEFENIGKGNKLLIGFTPESFRHMCILSGCDYLPSISGVGPSTAVKLMRRFNKDPFRVIKSLICKGGNKVPENYTANFIKADHAFLYQLVFDPTLQKQVRLNTPHDIDQCQLEHAGIEHSPSKQVGLARGNINPLTLANMDDYSPAKQGASSQSKSSTWHHAISSQQSKLVISATINNKKSISKPIIQCNEDNLTDKELCEFYGSSDDNKGVTSLNIGTSSLDFSHNKPSCVIYSKYFKDDHSSSPALDNLDENKFDVIGSLDSGIGDCAVEENINDDIDDDADGCIAGDDDNGEDCINDSNDEGVHDDDRDCCIAEDDVGYVDDNVNGTKVDEDEDCCIKDYNTNIDERQMDVKDGSDNMVAKRKLLFGDKSNATKRLKVGTRHNSLSTAVKSTPLRLGLSKTGKVSRKSFTPPRSTNSILSYFNYKQKDKLKH